MKHTYFKDKIINKFWYHKHESTVSKKNQNYQKKTLEKAQHTLRL